MTTASTFRGCDLECFPIINELLLTMIELVS
jgi:hypothetical protein